MDGVNGRIFERMNLWRGACGHAHGVIKKHKVKNDSAKYTLRVTVIYLLRASVDLEHIPDVIHMAGRVRATPDLTWTCSICGVEQRWEKRRNVCIERKEEGVR